MSESLLIALLPAPSPFTHIHPSAPVAYSLASTATVNNNNSNSNENKHERRRAYGQHGLSKNNEMNLKSGFGERTIGLRDIIYKRIHMNIWPSALYGKSETVYFDWSDEIVMKQLFLVDSGIWYSIQSL